MGVCIFSSLAADGWWVARKGLSAVLYKLGCRKLEAEPLKTLICLNRPGAESEAADPNFSEERRCVSIFGQHEGAPVHLSAGAVADGGRSQEV